MAAVRKPAVLSALRQRYPDQLLIEQLDATDFAWLPEIAAKYQDIDILVNYGLEGVAETLAQEIAEFNLKVQIIEPGSIKTAFQANVRWTEETETYKNSSVGALRRWIVEHGDENNAGDPQKMAAAIYHLSREESPELPTLLGADAFAILQNSYRKNLSSLEAQEAISCSVGIEGKTGFVPE